MTIALYRERAHLVALLAGFFPSVIVFQPDDPDRPIVYVHTPEGQLSWHLSKSDLDLFEHVTIVQPSDARAAWDGHTTEEKYARIVALAPKIRRSERVCVMAACLKAPDLATLLGHSGTAHRVINVLTRNDVLTIAQAKELTAQDLKDYRNFGTGSAAFLRGSLAISDDISTPEGGT